jgi:GAF domain-containing protein
MGEAGDRLGDPARVESLRRASLGPYADAAFDRFAKLVRKVLGVPVALVSIVEPGRQVFPGQVGLAEPWAGARETPLSHSLCQHVVAEGAPKVFPDARIYAQVRDNQAIPDLNVIAYAGFPLDDAEGRTLGSLCAIDDKPRAWTPDELAILADLAEACASELRLRIAHKTAEEARQAAEEARRTAEEVRQAAEEARHTAEDARQAAEEARNDAEKASDEAEQARRVADEARATAEDARVTADKNRVAAEEARQHAEIAHAQLAMLAELTEAFSTSADVRDGMRRLATEVVPRLADWCVVTLSDREGEVRRAAAAHREAELTPEAERFAGLMASGLASRSAVLSAQRSGLPVRREGEDPSHVLARTTDPVMAEIAGRLGYASFVVVPVPAPITGEVLGAITFVNGPGRAAFGEADERTAMDIARRAGLAIDNSRMYRRQRHVAEVLQHSMLPVLPDIPGVELHARYLPAQDGAAVGGDWYDAFAQPDGAVMLAVGDVSGHDIEAAATMGQLRNLVRGDAFGRREDPGPLLTRLERAIAGLGMTAAATAILARIEGREIAYANAGHPPPILLREDGSTEVWWENPEPLLGLVPGRERTTHRRVLPPGATLLLYTDGLIERPGSTLDEGIARVERLLVENARRRGEELCELLVTTTPRRRDDTALLMVRLE